MAFTWMTPQGTPGTVLFNFTSVTGTPKHPRREYKIIDRPGIDNFGVSRKGLFCPEYQLGSNLDCVDPAAAEAVQLAYAAVEGSVLDLYYQNHFWSSVFIIAAEPETMKIGRVGVGGLNNGPVVAPCTWFLKGVA